MEKLGERSKKVMIRGLMVSLMTMLVLGGFGSKLFPRDVGAGPGGRAGHDGKTTGRTTGGREEGGRTHYVRPHDQ